MEYKETIILQRKNTYRFLFLPLLVERKIDGIPKRTQGIALINVDT